MVAVGRIEPWRSPWHLLIPSHESDCQHETANSKFMISEVMSFVCSDSCKTGVTKEKSLKKVQENHLFKVFRVPERCTGIFNVSNACTKMLNKLIEENEGVKKQKSKKGFEKNEHACSIEGVFLLLDSVQVVYKMFFRATEEPRAVPWVWFTEVYVQKSKLFRALSPGPSNFPI